VIAFLLLAQAITFAILSAIIASNKNRNAAGWGTLGFIFGLFGFIAAIAVGEAEQNAQSSRRGSARQRKQSSTSKNSSDKKKNQQSKPQKFDPDQHEKKCPDCAEYIKLEARVCKHCGHRFSDEEVERQVEERRKAIEDEQQNEEDRKEKTVDLDNLTKPQRHSLDTHRFIGDRSECDSCGLSKAYIVEHLYECPYSER
jgi:hypothetical protein